VEALAVDTKPDMQPQMDIQKLIRERFAQLPKVVQTAITSADIEKQLRELANTHKLHLDQWQTLENEVVMTLIGINPVEELSVNLQKQLAVSNEIAKSLTADISKIVFEPIREQLERELEHPDAKAAEVSGVEAARTQILGSEDRPAAPVAPAASRDAAYGATDGEDSACACFRIIQSGRDEHCAQIRS